MNPDGTITAAVNTIAGSYPITYIVRFQSNIVVQ
jgi:hypothetical protein